MSSLGIFNKETKTYQKVAGTAEAAVVDAEMSDASTNTVQNKVIKKYVDDSNTAKLDKSSVINNHLTSDAGYALDARQANPNVDGSLGAQIKAVNETVNTLKKSANVNLMSKKINGINYSATNTEEALGDKNENLIISVSGKGKILWMIPFFDNDRSVNNGVARLKIDGKRLFCKRFLPCAQSDVNYGYCLFTETLEPVGRSARVLFCEDSSSVIRRYYLHNGGYFTVQDDISNKLISSIYPLYLPGGLYFNDGFELEAIQTSSNDSRQNFGFFVGYELYE